MTLKQKFVLGRVQNIVGRGKIAGNHRFPLFLQGFQQATLSKSLKPVIVW